MGLSCGRCQDHTGWNRPKFGCSTQAYRPAAPRKHQHVFFALVLVSGELVASVRRFLSRVPAMFQTLLPMTIRQLLQLPS
jgi:hypothetical protein